MLLVLSRRSSAINAARVRFYEAFFPIGYCLITAQRRGDYCFCFERGPDKKRKNRSHSNIFIKTALAVIHWQNTKLTFPL
jgi:hypothetical protein